LRGTNVASDRVAYEADDQSSNFHLGHPSIDLAISLDRSRHGNCDASLSRITSRAFLSSRSPTNLGCLRWPAGVHSIDSNAPTRRGLSHRQCFMSSAVSPPRPIAPCAVREIGKRAFFDAMRAKSCEHDLEKRRSEPRPGRLRRREGVRGSSGRRYRTATAVDRRDGSGGRRRGRPSLPKAMISPSMTVSLGGETQALLIRLRHR